MTNNSVKYFLSFLVVSQCAFGIDVNIQSYKDRGVRYTPHYIQKGFTKYCKASWYGKGFHRSLTASGERYNMHDYTAAHRTFAMGTRVKVTNLSNNKSVVVRVNDRGPFYNSRDIDLSYGAATRIGMVNSGVGKIKMEVISSGKNTFKVAKDESKQDENIEIAKIEKRDDKIKIAKASNEKKNHFVQVASFDSKKYAELYTKQNKNKENKLLVKAYPTNISKNPVYRVVAEFDNLLKAKQFARHEQNKGSFLIKNS
ncbi:MAG: septal ring lytic transglycosylase RlpA family protein [Sulfurovum sp.]|nr:MAG: septal ring lytic transglycosylase RlpA family protein [Sulfurovum sp.]